MSQIIFSGAGAINNLEKVLKEQNSKKFLLVRDSSFPFLSIKDDIERVSVPCAVFDGFTPNPLYEDVCKGVDIFEKEGCDFIVAVGGGSAIDVAKCIKLYCKMDKSVNYLEQEPFDSEIPLLAIPTTAGTGSESTRFAVIYFEGKKQSVSHLSIIPSFAILESSVLKTLPLYQKKCTMLDALCQGIESYWSVNSTDESKEYSRQAIRLIMENKDEYLDGCSQSSAEKIMLGANFSGKAINITQTTAAHAMSYKITSLYKAPHGHAVAVCLPKVFGFMLENTARCSDNRGEAYLVKTFNEIANLMGADTPQDAINMFEKMLLDMEIINPKSENREDELDILASSVNPVRLKNNPVLPTEGEVRRMYEKIIL